MIITKTPLRCSFFGGGTDFKDYYENSRFGYGAVLSAALNIHVYITVNKNFDGKIRLCYSGNEIVDTVANVKHNIIRNALQMLDINDSIEIFYSADIPLSSAGIGLASSSALAVGVLNALHAWKGEYVSADQLAREACHIEIDCLGQKIGIQDQYAVAHGGFNRYRFHHNGYVSVEPTICSKVTFDKMQRNLMLFYTGLLRDSRKIFDEQTRTMSEKTALLDSLVEMVDQGYISLISGDVDILGSMLDEAWAKKKQFSDGVSNPLIDGMYQSAKDAGALGGKILGAGGGGFMLLYVPEDKQLAVDKALAEFRRVPFGFEGQGSHIIFAD
jgi:D-glycero-alpha-D-manno-heptose-7-phosphate kinase